MTVSIEDWENYRNPDRSLDVERVFEEGIARVRVDMEGCFSHNSINIGRAYLDLVTSLKPIHSRQIASVAVATASVMVNLAQAIEDIEP